MKFEKSPASVLQTCDLDHASPRLDRNDEAAFGDMDRIPAGKWLRSTKGGPRAAPSWATMRHALQLLANCNAEAVKYCQFGRLTNDYHRKIVTRLVYLNEQNRR